MNHSLLSDDYIQEAIESPPTNTDQLLIQAIAAGDEAAFNELYGRYHRKLYAYLSLFLGDQQGAEDVLQDVFVAVWQGAKRFRGHSQVKTWLYRIAYRRAVSWIRKRSHSFADQGFMQDHQAINPEEALERLLEHERLRKALAELPIKQRSVVELAFGQGMSYLEIAEVMTVPVGTVKSRMSQALRSLSALIKRLEPDQDFGEI